MLAFFLTAAHCYTIRLSYALTARIHHQLTILLGKSTQLHLRQDINNQVRKHYKAVFTAPEIFT